MREPTPTQSIHLTDQQTLHDTMTIAQQHIPLSASGYRCQTPDLWRLLLAAAARRSTIESACADLSGAPDANTVRGYLIEQLPPTSIPDLERRCSWYARQANVVATIAPRSSQSGQSLTRECTSPLSRPGLRGLPGDEAGHGPRPPPEGTGVARRTFRPGRRGPPEPTGRRAGPAGARRRPPGPAPAPGGRRPGSGCPGPDGA